MARIIGFTVHGLAGREQPYSARLQEDVNVFFGINGSGKTTLLKILHSSLSTDASTLEGLPFKSAEVDVYLNRHEAVFRRRFAQPEEPPNEPPTGTGTLTFRTLIQTQSERLKWISEPAEPDGPRLTSYTRGYLPITRLYRAVGTQTSGARTISEDELDARFAAEVQRRWTDYQADVSTRIAEVQGEGLAKILHLVLSGEDEDKEVDTSTEIGNAYERVSAFLGRQEGFNDVLDSRQDFEVKYRTQPRIKSIVKQIDLVEKRIEKVNAPLDSFKRLVESMYSGNKKLVFGEKDITIEISTNTKIKLPSLSSGEKQLFFIAFEAIRSGNSSIIIDEPELSMHVDWQRKLITSLRELNPRMQLIMATHSPEIMADLQDEKIFGL
jgi:predicted ATPase